jgi:cyclopropane fatty-acyl-phospholipid synthase-like methyltransferase
MTNALRKLVNAIQWKLKPRYHIYKGVLLPPRDKRYLRESFRNDQLFYGSTLQEGIKLTQRLGVTQKTRILEVGCTTGRTFIGLVQQVPDIYYLGIDINRWNIEWCNKYLSKGNPNYNFHYFDLRHLMYNPNGTIELNEDFHFPYPSASFDVVYATGVLPNYITHEVRIIMNDFNRLLVPSGRLFITSFVEENVPQMEENPDQYLIKEYSYPRQVVRYERQFFDQLIREAGFRVDQFEHRTEIDWQSAYYLTRIS